MISAQRIVESHERIKPYIHRTPIIQSRSLNRLMGRSIYFKAEHKQKVGAFKFRGAMNALLQLPKDSLKRGFTTHSSGNHAQALALAAKRLRAKATIIMPKNASRVKVDAVIAYDATVIFCEPTLEAREEITQEFMASSGAIFIHPYDDERIIQGQATAAREVLEDYPDLDAIIAPVGGGGLLAGTCLSAKYFGKENIKVFAAEPEGADDCARSFKAKKLILQTQPNTIADGLLTSLGNLNWPIIKDTIEDVLVVNDSEIIDAMRLFWMRTKEIIETNAATTIAALIRYHELFDRLDLKHIGVILSGGNVDLDHLPW